jgi:hypothetical protein
MNKINLVHDGEQAVIEAVCTRCSMGDLADLDRRQLLRQNTILSIGFYCSRPAHRTRRVSSSLAAASLQDLGLHRATDLVGGFRARRDAGLPTR